MLPHLILLLQYLGRVVLFVRDVDALQVVDVPAKKRPSANPISHIFCEILEFNPKRHFPHCNFVFFFASLPGQASLCDVRLPALDGLRQRVVDEDVLLLSLDLMDTNQTRR